MLNWFPGHMNVARRDILKAMPKIDLVIEVLDARIPFSSENPLVARLRGDRPCIQILNKEDLADPAVTAEWLEQIEARPGVLALTHQQGQAALNQRLLARVKALVTGSRDRPVRAMILGIPNVGKSTLINALCGRVIAKTGNKPAVTRQQQRVKVGKELVLWDTPGFLWPRLSPVECGYRLAVTGAISDRVVEAEDIAAFAANFLARRYPERLTERYGLTELPEGDVALLEALGRARGYLRKGGVVDLARISKTLLKELGAGTLGRLSLETPADWEPSDEDDED
ncbi:MAG: ribosome biogenesis GTPase A [Myxococcota bacterium]|jgi:ribosome biogenesis GTPase A